MAEFHRKEGESRDQVHVSKLFLRNSNLEQFCSLPVKHFQREHTDPELIEDEKRLDEVETKTYGNIMNRYAGMT